MDDLIASRADKIFFVIRNKDVFVTTFLYVIRISHR